MCISESSLDRLDVYCLGPLVAGFSVVGDLHALGERAEAVALDARVMHEQILLSVVGRDEAEALVVAEPLDRSGCHSSSTFVCWVRGECFTATTRPPAL